MKISTFSPVLMPVGLPQTDTPQVNDISASPAPLGDVSTSPQSPQRRILERRRQRMARRAAH